MKAIYNVLGCAALWTLAVVFTFGLALVPLIIWALLLFTGSEKRAEASRAKLSRLLMEHETIVHDALQCRAHALFRRRNYLATTSSRIMVVQRGLLGGFKMQDFQWKDLEDVVIEENPLPFLSGARLAFKHTAEDEEPDPKHPDIVIDGIPADIAPTMYAKSQYLEQAWEEKRRIQDLEGPLNVLGGFGSGDIAGIADNIKKAKELLDMGALTDSEYQEMKAKIIARS